MKQFKWLHLTDLHVGQFSHDWLWPNFKTIFFEDLQRVSKQVGGFDVLIFSGDLTQKGSKEEYESLTLILREIYEKLETWGTKPKFFAVPGNHDLVRPDAAAPESLLLKRWWDEPTVSRQFWNDEASIYRIHAKKAFQNYTEWYENLPSFGIDALCTDKGILPGDISARVDFDDVSVGLIGLNSAFLQLDGGDYEAKLALDVRQILPLTGNDTSKWCSTNDINFLVTHHPPNWLESSAAVHFSREISPPGRFTAHLYGHMHQASTIDISLDGGPKRKSVQGPSIFGLEFLRDGTTHRLHGYSAGVVTIENSMAEWRLWPRTSHVRADGARQLIPDYNFALVPGEQYLSEPLNVIQNNSISAPVHTVVKSTDELSLTAINSSVGSSSILDRALYSLRALSQHSVVRVAAQQAFVTALALDRMVWLCTDWGLGTDGFLYSAIKLMNRQNLPVYRIDLGNYATRDEFLARFTENQGCSFAEFCRLLLKVGPAILLFDEAPSASGDETLRMSLDVEALGQMVLDFCPQVSVIAITRVRPEIAKLSCVELAPLDEPDTRAYIFSHIDAASDIKNPKSVAEIFRVTEGVPNKIERVLKTLRVVGLSEISMGVVGRRTEIRGSSEEIPRALSSAVAAILDSSDPSTQRTALLLRLLCILPHGETLQKIRRFDPQKIFYAQHAEELLDLALIDVKSGFGVMNKGAKGSSEIRLLSVRGPVRDYVQSLLGEREVDALVKKAMGLYFEQHRTTSLWRLRGRDGTNVSEDITTLDNAHELCLRTLVKAISGGQTARAKATLSLVQIYCGELKSGRHYRSCAAACESILNAIQEDGNSFISETLSLKYMLAMCLRMLGDTTRSKILCEELRGKEWPKEMKVLLLLNYAHCLQSLKDPHAIVVAQELIALSPKSDSAIQAKAIILEMATSEGTAGELLKLEHEAKKRGAFTVRNNLILSRATSGGEDLELMEALEEVLESSLKQNDPYNAGRAAVKIAALALKRGEGISSERLSRLIHTYQYFYGQRFDGLFMDAHKALWEIFEASGDVSNLLSLFKHSSFIWRLGGKEEREKPYVEKLINAASKLLTVDLRSADQDTAYFVARARSKKDGTEAFIPLANNDAVAS